MALNISICWDLDTCTVDSWDRIGIVVESIRRLYVLPNKLHEKRFVCFGSQHKDFNEEIERQLRIKFKRVEEQLDFTIINCYLKMDLMDNKTSLILISSNRYMIEDIINWKRLAPIHLIHGNSLNTESIEFSNNVKSLTFEKFLSFCLDFSDYIEFFYNLNSSDPSEEERNPIKEQKDGSISGTICSKDTPINSFFEDIKTLLTAIESELNGAETAQNNENNKKETEIQTFEREYIFPGVCGLKNLGNTCYMNSALQCLSNVSPLTVFVHQFKTRNTHFIQRPLIFIYCDLIREMWSGDHKVIAPNHFKTKISLLWNQFKGWHQNDCAELVSSILDKFHDELLPKQSNRRTTQSSYQTFDDYLKDNNTFIAQTFFGFQRYQLIHECGHNLTDEKQSFSIINLPQIDRSKAFSFFLILRNMDFFYKIELKLAQNPIPVIEVLRQMIQKFREFNEWHTLSVNNLIPVLIKDHFIETIYETNTFIDFEGIDGELYIYERDPSVKVNVFVILNSSQLFGLPLLLNVNKFSHDLIIDQFYNQMIRHLEQRFTEDYRELLCVEMSEYCALRVSYSDGEPECLPTQTHVLITDPISEYIRRQYNNPEVIYIESKECNYKLEYCLNQYLSVKPLDRGVYCYDCKTKNFPTEKTTILYSPNVLILQLKSDPRLQTLQKVYDFPLVLNFDEYLTDDKQRNGQNNYDLIAIVNYSGSIAGGHYFTYAKNWISNKWFNFNDSEVEEIDERQLISSNAYLLFYLKQ